MARFSGTVFRRNAVQNDPAIRRRLGELCGIVGIICNVLLFAGKFAAGLFSGSVSIQADAFNNLSDAGSSIVSIVGFRLSAKKPDSRHPFGYGRFEYIAGLCISLLIISVGIQFIRSSIEKIIHPDNVAFSWLGSGVLIGSMLIKLFMCLLNYCVGKRIQSPTVSAVAFDSLSDVLATAAVLASLIFSRFTSFPLDGVMGMVVSLFILWAGFSTAKNTISPLLGQAPDPEFVREIERLVLQYDAITGIHDLIVHSYGAGNKIVSLHAEIPANIENLKAHEIVDQAEREISKTMNIMLIIHSDPVLVNDPRTDLLHKKIKGIIAGIDPVLSIHDFRVVDGEEKINLIFDVLVPHGYKRSDNALRGAIDEQLKALDPRFQSVISFDRSFVPL